MAPSVISDDPQLGQIDPISASGTCANTASQFSAVQAKLDVLIAAFRHRLTRDEQESFCNVSSLREVELAISQIERDLAKRKASRNIARIRPFLAVLEHYTSVIEVFVNVKPDILGLIWGPIKFCLQVSSNVGKAFGLLLDAYKRIGECLPMTEALKDLFPRDPHVEEALLNILEDILAFHARSVRFFSQRGWSITCQLTFRPFEDLFGDLIKNFDRSKRILQSAGDFAHFKEAQEARRLAKQQYEDNERAIEDRQWATVRDWLSPPDHEVEHRALKDRRSGYPGTTDWIFTNSLMKDWLQSTVSGTSVLWLCGIPGAGKSVLFSSVVDRLVDGATNGTECATAYFYCKHNDDSKNRYEGVAKSLLTQLARSSPYCLDYLHQCSLRSTQTHASDSESFTEILQNLIQCFKQVFIGIDGLDECERQERQSILNLLKSTVETCQSQPLDRQVRILVASCEERDIEVTLSKLCHRLKVTSRHVESDIRLFITIEAAKLSQKFSYDKPKQEAIVSQVITRPKGMFLLARLIMDNLYDQTDREEVEEELKDENLPRGIGQAYGRIVTRILRKAPQKIIQRSKQILGMIAAARRSLYLHEVQGALAINLANKDVDFEGRQLRTHLKDICGSLIELQSDRRIQFIHPTAKDYLLAPEQSLISLSSSNFEMARLCLTFLELALALKPDTVQAIDFAKKGNYAFLTYAVQHWMAHILVLCSAPESRSQAADLFDRCRSLSFRGYSRFLPSLDQSELFSRLTDRVWTLEKALRGMQKLCDGVGSISIDSGKFLSKLTVRNTDKSQRFDSGNVHSGHSAVLMQEAYGILPYNCPVPGCSRFWQGFRNHRLRDSHVKRHERAEKCPYKDCYFNAWGFSNQKDLAKHISMRHGKGEVGPSWPALKPQSIWKTLEGAIDKNEIEVVRDLCLEINKHTYESRPEGFILRALRKDNFGTVHVLLDHMATSQEILHADKRGQTALHVASVKGEAIIVERLIHEIKRVPWSRRGILDFNKVTASHPMALAAMHSHFEVIRAFLTAGLVDGSTTEQGPAVPLLNAASVGSTQIVTLWIQHFPACLRAKHIETAISRAATKGHESCIRILLENAHEAVLSKPLASALSAGIQSAMEFVLSKRRKRVEKSDVRALMKAVSEGEESEIRRLVELLGVNITSRDSTPLQAAAGAGQQGSVRLLLDLGVGVNTKTGHMGTALAAAAAAGNVEIMKILLENDADPNLLFRSIMDPRAEGLQWDDDVTALHIAAQFGQKGAVELLLDVGANIGQTTKTGWTALAIAGSVGSVELVSLLSDRGAAPAVEWDELETPLLHRAIRSGQIDIVTMLLDKGSDVLGRGINGDLPIHVAAEQDEERIARLLIERGASATACNDHGGTALHARGLNGGSMEVPTLLLSEGADVNARNTDSETPLLKTLKSSSAKLNPDLSYAHFLLDSGANVDVEDADGNTPLHHLVERYYEWAPALNLARRMIEQRAEVDARNSWGNTPMHGIRYGFSQNRLTDGCKTAIELASVLLNAGADFDAENDKGETPRKIALGTGGNAFFPSSRALTWTVGKEIFRRIQDGMGFL